MHNRIKELRKELNLSQSMFAEKIGMSPRVIFAWEKGEKPIKEPYLLLIENTFDVNREWLREGRGQIFAKHAAILNDFSDVNIELLASLIDRVNKGIKERGMKLSSKKKIKLIVLLYEHYIKDFDPKITNIQDYIKKSVDITMDLFAE